MTTDTMPISGILNFLLSESGLSEAALGRKINIPRATINRLTSGRTPDPRASTLQAISSYFNITVDQLLGQQPLVDNRNPSAKPSYPLRRWQPALADETQAYALQVADEAMWPQFQLDSELIIDPLRQPRNRDFVIAYIAESNEVVFRQLILEQDYRLLSAINPTYKAILLGEQDCFLGSVIQTRQHFD